MARRNDLKKLRDKKIIEVFHQLFDINRMRLEDAYILMEREIFFLDAKYIHKLIFYNKENIKYYESLLKKNNSDDFVEKKLKSIKNSLKFI